MLNNFLHKIKIKQSLQWNLWSADSGESPCQNYGEILIKRLPTVVTSNQQLNGHLLLSQCLILFLLTVKQVTFCKQMFFHLENVYFLKTISL